MAQFGGPRTRLEPLLLAHRHLVLQQDAEPFEMIECPALRIGGQIAQAPGHANQAKIVQVINGGVLQHSGSPQW
jgi:hypothetical protein